MNDTVITMSIEELESLVMQIVDQRMSILTTQLLDMLGYEDEIIAGIKIGERQFERGQFLTLEEVTIRAKTKWNTNPSP